jgi:hypothetical protein
VRTKDELVEILVGKFGGEGEAKSHYRQQLENLTTEALEHMVAAQEELREQK